MAAELAAMTLVQAAKRGDDVAFDVLLEPLLEPAYRLACAMLNDHFAAEDAVQEAALKAWRKLVNLRDGAEMRPWFLGIVANECRTTRRSSWWSVLKSVAPDKPVDEPADQVLSGIELRRALLAMNPKKRLTLVLHWYLDLPLDEVAAITGSSLHATESRLERGIHELRQRMEGHRG